MYKNDNFFITMIGILISVLFSSFSVYLANPDEITKNICAFLMMISTVDIIVLTIISIL